jgi:hypothetical protein
MWTVKYIIEEKKLEDLEGVVKISVTIIFLLFLPHDHVFLSVVRGNLVDASSTTRESGFSDVFNRERSICGENRLCKYSSPSSLGSSTF